MIKKINRTTLKIILGAIRLYQKTLSFDHGFLSYRYPYGFCRFNPTCSEYAHQSFKKHGLGKGFIFSLKRLLKCHPFHQGGNDPVK